MRRAHRRAPAWLQNDTSLVENMKDIFYMVTKSTHKCTSYLRPIRSSGSTEGVLEETGRDDQHIITRAAPNEIKRCEGV